MDPKDVAQGDADRRLIEMLNEGTNSFLVPTLYDPMCLGRVRQPSSLSPSSARGLRVAWGSLHRLTMLACRPRTQLAKTRMGV